MSTSSLQAIDDASEAVRKGFRVTLADLNARVERSEYIYRDHLTIAVLWLDNGFALVGKSAPVDPSNYDQALGAQMAWDDALRQAWPLLAFAHLDAQPTCSCQTPDAVHRADDQAYHPGAGQ